MKVGDLVECSFRFESESIDHWTVDSKYPGTRDNFWLLEKDKCRVIKGLP